MRRTLVTAILAAASAAAVGQEGDGSDRFASDMYKELAAKEGNVFFSPFSIHAALSMTLAGARGKTASEMADVLKVKDAEVAGREYGAIVSSLENARKRGGFELNVANSIWGEQSVSFFPEFTTMLKDRYGSELRTVSYRSNSAGARREINNWVDEKTNSKIPELIASGILNSDTTMVLVNAIYFKAPWMHQFDKGRTEDGDFHTPTGVVKAKMMKQKIETRYADDDRTQIVELPYKSGVTSMLLILPREGQEISTAESAMFETDWDQKLEQMRRRSVQLSMPKWTTRYQADVGDTLKAMGMKLAFSDAADFSGMTTDERLAISNVIHEAFVAVDEQGTEAAAATAVAMTRLSMPIQEDIVEMTIDRPFVYAIRDNESGAILFAGRVTKPGD